MLMESVYQGVEFLLCTLLRAFVMMGFEFCVMFRLQLLSPI